MSRILPLLAMTVGMTGCLKDIVREDIEFAVEADQPFEYVESYDERLEGHSLEEIEVPQAVEIDYGEAGSETIVFSGTLPEGVYNFQLRFEHYGDMPRLRYTHWNVTITAE